MQIPGLDTPSVGIRELRAMLAAYIDADTAVTVARHVQAVGRFVPLRRPGEEDVQHQQTAVAKGRRATPLAEDDVEEMVADIVALRRGRRLPSPGA